MRGPFIAHMADPSRRRAPVSSQSGRPMRRVRTDGPGDGFYHSAILNNIRDFRNPHSGPSEIGPDGQVRIDYRSNSGSRCLNVGGNWGNGSNAGVAYANANNSLSNSNTNIGARLAYLPKAIDINLTLGKDPASRQKTAGNDSRSAGRWGKGSASERRVEIDRPPKGERR